MMVKVRVCPCHGRATVNTEALAAPFQVSENALTGRNGGHEHTHVTLAAIPQIRGQKFRGEKSKFLPFRIEFRS